MVRTGTSEKSAVHNDGVARAGVVAVVAAAIFLGSCLEKTEWLIVRGNDWNFNVIPFAITSGFDDWVSCRRYQSTVNWIDKL